MTNTEAAVQAIEKYLAGEWVSDYYTIEYPSKDQIVVAFENDLEYRVLIDLPNEATSDFYLVTTREDDAEERNCQYAKRINTVINYLKRFGA